MITKIDWLSFTLKIGSGEPVPSHRLFHLVLNTVYDFSDIAGQVIFAGWDYEVRRGRPPYSIGWQRTDMGIFIFAHPTLPHLLVEISGQGCDVLAADDRAAQFLQAVQPRLTRIDVASDMLVDTSPIEFVAARTDGRFKSHSEFVSETGTTAYVGSRTSNRYARVYRYNAPHARAHLLRAEHVLKAEDAKSTAYSILESGLPAVTVSLGAAFGWLHPSWTPDRVTEAELKVWRAERKNGKTLFWLNDTVASVLLRLAREGVIEPEAWLYENVIVKLKDSE